MLWIPPPYSKWIGRPAGPVEGKTVGSGTGLSWDQEMVGEVTPNILGLDMTVLHGKSIDLYLAKYILAKLSPSIFPLVIPK